MSTTQQAHPWRATIRTVVQVAVSLAALAPIILPAIGASAGLSASVIASILAVAAVVTRVMALPATDDLLRQIGLGWLAASTADVVDVTGGGLDEGDDETVA